MCLLLLVRPQRPRCTFYLISLHYLLDPYEVFERYHPDLVAFDSNGNPIHHIDFMAREKKEMRQLTQATQICDNVWVRIRNV